MSPELMTREQRMGVTWKKKRNLKPEVILKKLDSVMTVSADKKVSFAGFEHHDAMAALQSMVSFPSTLTDFSKERLLSKAVFDVAREGELTSDKVINALNALVRSENARKESVLHLLTSISLANVLLEKKINIESCELQLLDGDFPQKFASRSEVIKSNGRDFLKNSGRDNYTKIIISTKAKTAVGAVTRCLRALDIQRAMWCFFSNTRMEIIGNESMPINEIRLGEVHTIHKDDGHVGYDGIWHEPNFVKAKLYSPEKIDIFTKNTVWALTQLEKSNYSQSLKEALLRYVRAFDERDQNVAFVRLWGALESISAPFEANYDPIIRRCSFLFAEHEYHKQVLEHLRECRNRNLHAGDQNERAKTNCFQLQNYFRQLILFHLGNTDDFASLSEANELLDLPIEKDILNRRKQILEKAIKYRWPANEKYA